MIRKEHERKRALELRKSGLSYNEILERVSVAKSTLSLWLRSVGLAKRHQRRISEKQRQAQQRGVRLVHERRLEKMQRIMKEASTEVRSLSKRERWLIGIALYWAEGTKEKEQGTLVQFSNSDPHMVLLFQQWLMEYLKIPSEDIVHTLYIHERSPNLHRALEFWSDFLSKEPYDFKVVFKRHNPSPKRKNIGVKYRGLVRLTVRRSVDMNRRIAGWIDGIIGNAGIVGE